MPKEMPMIVTEGQALNTRSDNGHERLEEHGKTRIWVEVWQTVRELEPEIEQLSQVVEELEYRKEALAKKRVLAKKQRADAEVKAEEVRRHKRFKLFTNKKKLAALNQRAEALREAAQTLAKQEQETTTELRMAQGKLTRRCQQRSYLCEILRCMS